MKAGFLRAAALWTALCVTLFCCVSCRGKGESDPEALFARLLASFPHPSVAVYENADLSDKEGLLAGLYGKSKAPETLRNLPFFAALSQKDDGFEIELFVCAHPSQCESVYETFRMREKTLHTTENKRYLMEDYERFLAGARVYQRGEYLFFLVCGDNDTVTEQIDRIFPG